MTGTVHSSDLLIEVRKRQHSKKEIFLLRVFKGNFGAQKVRNFLTLRKKIPNYMTDFSYTRRARASREWEGTRGRLAPYGSSLRCGLEVLEVAEGRLAARSLSNWRIVGYKSTTAFHFDSSF